MRRLAKKYRHIRQDIQPILDLLQEGQTPGTQIPRVRYAVYKVRVRNRDARSGTRGGYRMIYYLKTARRIVLITLYSKSEQGDVEVETIRTIIDRYERERFGDA